MEKYKIYDIRTMGGAFHHLVMFKESTIHVPFMNKEFSNFITRDKTIIKINIDAIESIEELNEHNINSYLFNEMLAICEGK